MSQINTTRDAGTGQGTRWNIRGGTAQTGLGSRIESGAAALTVTSASRGELSGRWSRPATPPPLDSLARRAMDRKLVQWTAAYLTGAWLVLQFIDVLAEIWSFSMVLQQVTSLVLGFGVLPALVVAWYHGEKGRQEICSTECALVAATIMASVVAIWMFCLTTVS